MFKNEKNENFKEVETLIGPSIKVKGNFHGQGNIVVEGILEGSLKTSKNIFIGDKAKITANIEAEQARVGGEVRGNIKVSGSLLIVSSAKINGNIECSSLSVEKGATINGNCLMTNGEAKKESSKNNQ